MVYLFTDFGSHDLYVGQLHAALLRVKPNLAVIDLLHEAPGYAILPSAHLLAALNATIPDDDAIMLSVVDPGVGGVRRPVVMQAEGRWFVGPDNGLLSVVARRAKECRFWEISWRPEHMSSSFHGRDLFAPIAAMLGAGEWWPDALQEIPDLQHRLESDDLFQIIYVDHYGNAITGIRQGGVQRDAQLQVTGREIPYARVYSEAPVGTAFWYENSIGLVEIAVNCGHAARQLGLAVGTEIRVIG